MKLPAHWNKGLTDEIIYRVALDFMEHDKDGHKDEEEDKKNDAYVLSSYEENE